MTQRILSLGLSKLFVVCFLILRKVHTDTTTNEDVCFKNIYILDGPLYVCV